MRHIQTEITINAASDIIWEVLMDFEKYQSWNPFIQAISGEAKVGSTLKIEIHPPGAKPMVFKPKVLTCEPSREFRWLGKGPLPGLFDGEHLFKLEALEGGKTRFLHEEEFTGILVGLSKKLLDKTEVGFSHMNEALKEECEKR
jgi:hypothetical protein